MEDNKIDGIKEEIREFFNIQVHEVNERIKSQYKVYEDKLAAELDVCYKKYKDKINDTLLPELEKEFKSILLKRCQKIVDRVANYLYRM